jgi:adiponectin receptor
MLKYEGMKWYLIELSLYASGTLIYAVSFAPSLLERHVILTDNLQFRVPERFAPGKFDIWGNSHQIFHVFIMLAMWVNCLALTQSFKSTHTLDLCHIQAARLL